MAKPPKAFDVWFVAADTVYRGVPYGVVADWVGQGRLAPADMVRPAGTQQSPWAKVEGHELLSDYLPRTAAAFEVVDEAPPAAAPVELPDPEPPPRRRREEEDDDVDMIPLIDISMVLLVFFIMMRAAGALAPIDVPEMRYAGELTADPDAITINVDKADEFTVAYSVRKGTGPPRPDHGPDRLVNPEMVLAAVDILVAEAPRPPEVRVACHKDLPNDRVVELQAELERRLEKNLTPELRTRLNNNSVNSYVATVTEAEKK